MTKFNFSATFLHLSASRLVYGKFTRASAFIFRENVNSVHEQNSKVRPYSTRLYDFRLTKIPSCSNRAVYSSFFFLIEIPYLFSTYLTSTKVFDKRLVTFLSFSLCPFFITVCELENNSSDELLIYYTTLMAYLHRCILFRQKNCSILLKSEKLYN